MQDQHPIPRMTPEGLYREIGPTEQNNVSSLLKCNMPKWITGV